MKIRGREINFLKTVKATCDLIDICPEKDITRMGELFNGDVAQIQRNGAILIHTLNEGYEMNKHFEDATYTPHILSIDEILYLTQEEYTSLLGEAMKCFTDGNFTVETEKAKKKEINKK